MIDRGYRLLSGRNFTRESAFDPSLSRPRIFFGPNEIAGNNIRNCQALRALGYAAYSINLVRSKFKYPSDAEYRVDGNNKEEILTHKLNFVKDIIPHFDVFYFNYGQSFHPDFKDIELLKNENKKIIMQFVGCDTFARDIALKTEISTVMCTQCHFKHCSAKEKLKYIRFWEKHADLILCGPRTSGLLSQVPEWIPVGIDLLMWKSWNDQFCDKERPLIIHAPSARDIKGTSFIVSAVEQLRSEGFKFSFKLLEGIPQEDMRAWINRSDLVIDQLNLGWYGSLSVESMALSKPVIAFIHPEILKRHTAIGFGTPPIISADSTDIYSQLRSMLNQQQNWSEIGQAGRDFVEIFHDVDKNSKQLLNLIIKVCSK